MILWLRQKRQCGGLRLSPFLQRYHQVYVSPSSIAGILNQHRMPGVSLKYHRHGPHCRRNIRVPRQSAQVDVKHLKLGNARMYEFAGADETIRYRSLKIHDHNSIQAVSWM